MFVLFKTEIITRKNLNSCPCFTWVFESEFTRSPKCRNMSWSLFCVINSLGKQRPGLPQDRTGCQGSLEDEEGAASSGYVAVNLSPVPQEGDSQEWVLVELEGGSGSAGSKPDEEERSGVSPRSSSPLALPRTWSDPLPQRASSLIGSGEFHAALCHTGPPFARLPGLTGLTGISGVSGLRRLPTLQPATVVHLTRAQLEQVCIFWSSVY